MSALPEQTFVQNSEWAAHARAAAAVAALFAALLLGADAAAGHSDWRRALLWTAHGLVLLAVLWPTRVRAAPGLLLTRGLVHHRHVRTDRLVAVAWHDGVAQRLVLTDLDGNRLEVDPRVLARNPALWHVVDHDIGPSVSRGLLCGGREPLLGLRRRIDRETARTVFKVSGL